MRNGTTKRLGKFFSLALIIFLLPVFSMSSTSNAFAKELPADQLAEMPSSIPTDTPPSESITTVSSEIEEVSPYLSIDHRELSDGTSLSGLIINGPPEPPAGYEAERVDSIQPLPSSGVIANFPSFDWVFGCSAVSGAMIATYYDRTSYPNIYVGPTNGGVMPLSDTSWNTWSDGHDTYPNNPLIASHKNVDGRTTRGSIDDYWVQYGSTANDPYITNGWTQHAWGTAIGDYMKTSQSGYGNTDGSTGFYTYASSNNKLTCSTMQSQEISDLDGTYGRKLFYEARGYTVTDCYNQKTDNTIPGGFSLANFQAEIDAGHPVLLNLEGHSIVGYGYSGSTIYVRDTWDNNPNNTYTMSWGGYYSGMRLLSVSVVNLTTYAPPAAFNKSSPADNANLLTTSPDISWSAASGAASYEYCYDTSDDDNCSGWVDNGTSTSTNLADLSSDTTYYWQVRAVNTTGTTYANNGAWWSFTLTEIAPEYDEKLTTSKVTFDWSDVPGATSYKIQLSTDPAFSTQIINLKVYASEYAFDTSLSPATTYFWRIRPKYGDVKGIWSEVYRFYSMDPLAAPVLTDPGDGALLSPNITLYWDAVVNAAQYKLQVATDSAFTDRVFSGKLTDTFKDFNDLAPGKYYWRVIAIEEGGLKGPWSVVRGFTVTMIFPPVLISPDNEAEVGPDVTLSWNTVVGAVQYKLQVSKDAAFTKLIVNEKTTELSKDLTALAARNYYWRVKAIDAEGFKSPWSEVRNFTVVP